MDREDRIYLIVVITIVLFGVFMLVRNNNVHKFRTNTLWGKNGLERHNELPSYNEMVWKFWRPINSFTKEI